MLHMTYGFVLSLALFGLWRHPWIARLLLELATLAAFVLVLSIGAGFWTGVIR